MIVRVRLDGRLIWESVNVQRRLARLMYDLDLLRFRLALGRRTLPWTAR